MNKSKKPLAMLSTAAVAGLLAAAIVTPVSAKTTALGVTGKDTKSYEYNFDALKASATSYILGGSSYTAPGAQLYADFMTRKATISAYYDDVKAAYVDAAVVQAEATKVILAGGKFDLNSYTSAASTATTPLTTTKVTTDANGNVLVGGVAFVSSVSAITATTTVGIVPTLPTTATVTLSDGTTKTAAITWNTAATAAATYATAGTVTVSGTLADYSNYAVSGTVSVVANTNLGVQSVTVVNDKQFKVTFNKAIKDTSVITTPGTTDTVKAGVFTLVRADGSTNASAVSTLSGGSKAVLSADGKTLTITDDHASNYFDGTYAFTILANQVETTTGEKLDKYTSTITFKDATRPTITGVEYVSNGTARVLFSEPVLSTGASIAFTDATGTAIAAAVIPATATVMNDAINGKYYVTVDLSAPTVPTNSNITATLVGYKDFAGNVVSPNPATATVKKDVTDTTAPTVVSATVTSNTTADIKFSEALDETTISIAGNIQIGSPAADVAKFVKDTTDPTLYHVTFAAPQTGLNSLSIAGSVLKDKAGNSLAVYSKLLNFAADTTAPTITSTTLTKVDGVESLIVTFSENVAVQAGKTITASRVKDYVTSPVNLNTTTTADAVLNNVNAALYNAVSGKSNSIAIALSNVADGQYTVTLPTGLVKDLYGNDSAEKTSVTFTRTTDNTTGKPALIAVSPIVQGTDNNTVLVKFDKKLDPTTALNKANYTVEGATVDSVALVQNLPTDGQVALTLKTGTNTFSGTHVFTISGVKSDAGVVMDSVTTSATINENVAPTITKGELTSTTGIKLTFSEAVSNATNAGADFELYIGGVKSSKTLTVGVVAAGSEAKELNVTVGSALTSEELAAGVTIKAVSTLDIADAVGNKANVTGAVTITQ